MPVMPTVSTEFMTMLIIAQTTIPSPNPYPGPHGMSTWSLGEWISFFGVLTGFMTLTLTPFLLRILAMYRQMVEFTQTSIAKSSEAKAAAEGAQLTSAQNTQHLINLAQNMPVPPAPVQVTVQPTTPVPATGSNQENCDEQRPQPQPQPQP